jgi:hypothetical protein
MAAPVVRSSSFAVSGYTVTTDAGTLVDDLVIIITWSQGTTIPTHTLQSGFTEVLTQALDDGTTDARLSIAYKIATSAGAQTYTPYSSGAAGISSHIVIEKDTFDAADPFDGVASTTSTGTGPPDPPSATASTAADRLVIAIGAWRTNTGDGQLMTPPSGYTELFDADNQTAASGSQSAATLAVSTSGGHDPGAFGDSFAPTGSAAATLLVNPSVAAPIAKSASDSVSVGITDAVSALFSTSSLSDSLSLSLTESTSLLGLASVADSLGISLTEAVQLFSASDVSDTLAVGITDSVLDILVLIAVSDTLGISLSEVAEIVVTLLVSDTISVALVETVALLVALSASDTLSVSLTEAVSLLVEVAATDTLGLSLAESVDILVRVVTNDLLGLTLTEESAVMAVLNAADSLGISLTEAALVTIVAVAVEMLQAFLNDSPANRSTFIDRLVAHAEAHHRAAGGPTVSDRSMQVFTGDDSPGAEV